MTTTKAEVDVRPMTLEDPDAIFFIDHEIRRKGQAITYANLTTERVFAIDRHVGRLAKPVSYIDLIKGDVSDILALSFVAKVEGHVRGFILGRIAHAGETATEIGTIAIVGVHPDYQQRGIAAQLVNILCKKYLSRGIKTVRIDVDRRDKELLNFVERMGFGVGHLIDYHKVL
jgi:ribosomal protein S18 acetylase RimI-like enzyme